MTTTLEAVYEKGVLRLPTPLPLPEQAHVLVTIQTHGETGEDAERTAWLRLSETTLTRTWDNPEDDVFNELLAK
jgi:predicted DNA-binding antitoxin AbrB/MazE fold protein